MFLFIRTIPSKALTLFLKSGKHSQPWRKDAVRGRIYVVGGFADICGPRTSSSERFDGAWSTMPPMTQPRCFCSTAEKLYACGEDGSVSITVERFHPALDTWELLRPTLHRRRHTSVAVLCDWAASAMSTSLWIQSSAMTPRQTLGQNRLLCHTHALAPRLRGSVVISLCSAVL